MPWVGHKKLRVASLCCSVFLLWGSRLPGDTVGTPLDGALAAALDVISVTPASEADTIGPAYSLVRSNMSVALDFALGVLKSPKTAPISTVTLTEYVRAKSVFEALGTNAPLSLVPELSSLVNQDWNAPVVAFALARLGEPGGLALIGALSHTNSVVRFASCNWISEAHLGTNEAAAVRALGALAAGETNLNIRNAATVALGAVRTRGEDVERLLLNLAKQSEDPMFQRVVLRSLSKKAPLSPTTRKALEGLYLSGKRGDKLRQQAEVLLGLPEK